MKKMLESILSHANEPTCNDFYTNNMDMFGFIQICSQNEDYLDYEDDNNVIHFPSLESNKETVK